MRELERGEVDVGALPPPFQSTQCGADFFSFLLAIVIIITQIVTKMIIVPFTSKKQQNYHRKSRKRRMGEEHDTTWHTVFLSFLHSDTFFLIFLLNSVAQANFDPSYSHQLPATPTNAFRRPQTPVRVTTTCAACHVVVVLFPHSLPSIPAMTSLQASSRRTTTSPPCLH